MPICNDINALHPDLRRVFEATAPKWKAQQPNFPVGLNETSRAEVVQDAYFSRGRQPAVEVLRLYKLAGVPVSKAEVASPEKISNAKFGQSPHNFAPARALDIRPTDKAGRYLTGSEFVRICQLYFVLFHAEAVALGVHVTSGAGWKDWPHIELTNWRKM